MFRKTISCLLILVIFVTGCSPSLEDRIAKADQLLRSRSYDEAIDLYEEVLKETPSDYGIWHNLVKAYIRQDRFEEAQETLEAYYLQVVSDEDLSLAEKLQPLQDIIDYVKDLRADKVSIGSWYDVVEPPSVDLSHISKDYEPGMMIDFVVPKGFKAYYTLDDTIPDATSLLYEAPFQLEATGIYPLKVVLMNEFGLLGSISFAEIVSVDLPSALEPSLLGGDYEESLVLYFDDYDYETMDLYYSIDGSDPLEGNYYDSYSGIRMTEGFYTLRAIYYDYNTSEYSRETYETYTIKSPYSVSEMTDLNVAIYVVSQWEAEEVGITLNTINDDFSNMNITYYIVDSLDQLLMDLEDGTADMVYTSASYVEDMGYSNLIVPIADLFNVNPNDYYNEALNAGFYEKDYYTLPVVIAPTLLLYYQNEDTINYYEDIDDWDKVITVANEGNSGYNFLYPEDMSGEWLFGFYLGYGGKIGYNEAGNYVLDPVVLEEAMKFAYELPVVYSLGFEGMDVATYYDAIESQSATMILGFSSDMTLYDTMYSYMSAGAMPLPNGGYAGAVNDVRGLHVTESVVQDENQFKVAQLIHHYLVNEPYGNYIAGYGEGLPAKSETLNPDYLWLDGDFEDYEHAIINNITIPYTYQLAGVFELMTIEMSNVFYGSSTIEEGAQRMVEAIANGETYVIE